VRTEFRVNVFNVSDEIYDKYDVAVAAARRALSDGKHVTLEERHIGSWTAIDIPYASEEHLAHGH
jgi:hypothetical protein